jgi:flagellar assembly factor FliW
LQIETRYFGTIDYDESKVILFPHGLPGFPDDRHFILMPETDPPELFYWLQSVDNGDVAFTLVDLYQVLPDYNPLVNSDDLAALGNLHDKPLEIYNIVVIPDNAEEMRVNLKAPIAINMSAGIGMQVIVTNDEYPIRYKFFNEMNKFISAEKDI